MGLYQNVLESADGGAFVNLRDSSGTGITSTLVGSSQALDVNVANTVTVGIADESSFTYGTTPFQPVGGVYNTSITQLTSGQSGALSLTSFRDVRVNLRTSGGAELGNSNTNGLFVKPGDGTNAQSYASTGEAYSTLRQGGNVANVNASNQLLVLDGNAGSILALMTPTTGTLTQVAVTTSNASLLASNGSRKAYSVQNATNKTIYIATGATATSSAYTVAILPNGFYEATGSRVYTGAIAVIGASGVSGNAIVTEYT